MNISEAAARSGLPVKTIRYYEDIALVAPARGPNGYRQFGARDVHKLTFLARARDLGFTIGECRTLLALWEDRDRASADVRHVAERHLADIDRRIDELQSMRRTLAHLVDCCSGDDRPDCPILDRLAEGKPP